MQSFLKAVDCTWRADPSASVHTEYSSSTAGYRHTQVGTLHNGSQGAKEGRVLNGEGVEKRMVGAIMVLA